ncbi:hypothetical protein [Streptomyces sp. NPDC059378]|uniref:hypothetical protein n=1 Tax=Streptomyces sp. NPDC059378 TaxID=3346815 RepID=UPI0036797307
MPSPHRLPARALRDTPADLMRLRALRLPGQRRSLLRAHSAPITLPTAAMYAVKGPSFRTSPGIATTVTISSHPHPATAR